MLRRVNGNHTSSTDGELIPHRFSVRTLSGKFYEAIGSPPKSQVEVCVANTTLTEEGLWLY